LLDAQALKKAGVRPAAIRVGVRKGGCNGYVYTMHFADKVTDRDEVVRDEDVTVIVDPKALMTIVGTEMDYQHNKLKSEFIFTNPNATGTCGCGESFSTSAPSHNGTTAQQAADTLAQDCGDSKRQHEATQ
jgi:iron-sulfur cluster assembly protein